MKPATYVKKKRSMVGYYLPIKRIERAYLTRAKERIRRRKIARTIEMFANGIQIKDISIVLQIDQTSICAAIKNHFFYYRGEDPVIIVLQSKINIEF